MTTNQPTTYHYFVSYSFTNRTGFGFGNCQIDLHYPIRSQQDVLFITDILREQAPGNPVVLSFTRYDNDTIDSGTGKTGPLDVLAFDYIRDMFGDNGNQPLSLDAIATALGFPHVAVRRVVTAAVRSGRMIEVTGGYRLKAGKR